MQLFNSLIWSLLLRVMSIDICGGHELASCICNQLLATSAA